MLRERIEFAAAGRGITVKGLSEAGMVDLLGMFRRRPAKRSPPGFARPREDITALGDSMGDMLTSPVRDAPPIARDGVPGLPSTTEPASASRKSPAPREPGPMARPRHG